MTEKPKDILFKEEARNQLGKGIDCLADTVAVTLGPSGRNIGLDAPFKSPHITSDGHSIAKEIELKNRFSNMGVSLGQEVAAKIKERTGDGTTTGIILFRSLVRRGLKQIAAGGNPTSIKRGMEKGLKRLLEEIDQASIPIANNQDIKNIATVSASGDIEIGRVIAECFEKVKKTGVIAIEEGKGVETVVEMTEGMQFDKGYASPYFCTDSERMEAVLSHPKVLITDKKLSSIHELLPILQDVAASGSELLIVAEEIDKDALSTLVVNKMRGNLKAYAVKAPGFGEQRKALLQDIATLTGAQVIAAETGQTFKEAASAVLGSAEQITIGKEKTTILGGKGCPRALEARILQINQELKKTKNRYEKEKLAERKAKLTGGVAVIRVGALTESEMKKKKQLFEDSLNATRRALEEGIVIGGGIALLRAAKATETLKLESEEALGLSILIKAAEEPFRQIVSNAGKDPSTFLEKVARSKETFGFNALTLEVEDLLLAGIIDPANVVKSAISHAVSMAGVVFLSEALIAPALDDSTF